MSRRNYYKTPQNVKKLIKEHVLCDAWRTLNPKCKQFRRRNLTLNIASRVDYFMTDTHLLCNVLSCDIRPLMKYDHNAVSFKLALDKVEKGPGFWKLNTQVLKEPDYQNNIRNIIGKIEQTNMTCIDKWELIKIRCREFSQKYSSSRKISIDKLIHDLEKSGFTFD